MMPELKSIEPDEGQISTASDICHLVEGLVGGYKQEIQNRMRQNERLKEKNAFLIETLEYYEKKCLYEKNYGMLTIPKILLDHGKKAREALEKIKEI